MCFFKKYVESKNTLVTASVLLKHENVQNSNVIERKFKKKIDRKWP